LHSRVAREETTESEVGEFCVSVGGYVNVLEFDVSVSDPEAMQMCNHPHDIVELPFRCRVVETLASLDRVVEIAAMADLHDPLRLLNCHSVLRPAEKEGERA
jgi:hypothetical protein